MPALFHHIIAWLNTPEVGGRGILGPHFRPLRIIAVPWPRLEITKLLVELIEFGEGLGA